MDTLRISGRKDADIENTAVRSGRDDGKGSRDWRVRAWLLYASLGVLATGVYFLLPSTPAQNLLYDLIGVSAFGAIAVGIRSNRPSHPLPWWLFASGVLLSVCGDVVWSFYEGVLGVKVPFPSVADAFYLAAYPLIGVGLASMVRTRAPGRAWAGLIDATIIAACAGILSWAFLMEPYAGDPQLTLLERLVCVAYPLMDVLLLGLFLRLLFLPGERPGAFYLLSASMVLWLGADTVFAAATLTETYQTGDPVDAGWLLSYALWGAAALHPSMAALSEPIAHPEQRLTLRRLALLGAASLVVPGILVIEAVLGEQIDVPVFVGGFVVLFLLVATRLAGLIREHRCMEEALRRRDAILGAVSLAAERFIEEPDWREGVQDVLEQLGVAAAAERAYVFEKHTAEDNSVILVSQLYEWTKPDVTPEINNPELQGFPLREAGFARWEEALSQRQHLYGHVREFPESERNVLSAQGILSIAVVPIFVGRQWWGFVGFDQCSTERDWTAGEIEALRTAAGTMGAAIQRRRTQEALGESERRFATLLSNAPAYLYRCLNHPDWPSDFVSDYAFELTGYTPQELTDGTVMFGDLIVEEDKQRVWEEVQAALAERRRFRLRYTIRRRDGEIRHVEEHGQGVYGEEDGEVLALEGIVHDVTERERAEGALKEAEERYRALVEQVPAVTYIQQPGEPSRTVYVSPQNAAMLGYSPEECTSDPEHWIGTIHPEDRERVLAEDRHTNQTGEPFAMEYRRIAKDGRVVWVRDEAVLLRDEEYKPLYWQGVQFDMTERKRAEEALEESERRLRAVVGNVPVILFALDREGIFTLSEGKGLEALGLESGQVVGLSVFDVYRDAPEILRYVRRALGGAEVSATVEVAGRAFETSYSPIRDEDGNISGTIGVAADVTERRRAEEQLRHQALHDALTGLPNRALFMKRLEQALARAERRGSKAAVLFMDLNNFKVINDSLGHEAGDELLVGVAERLKGCLRPEDTAARLGGDEFVMLLEDLTDASEATRVAERVADKLRTPFALDGQEAFVTASVGIALSSPGTNRPAELLRDADTAMYRAKYDGDFRVFEPSMYAQAVRRLELENSLRRAVEHEEFEVCYQPQVSLQTRELVGVEALVRWRHPERGLVGPSEFMPIAEETGLILPIGRWVLEEACRQAKKWQRRHPGVPRLLINVNLSANQLRCPGFADTVARVLEETGLEPGCLILDVTETTLVDVAENDGSVALEQLRKTGIRISIDDFGRGYSSLSYLKRLPADILKVDKAFVDGLGEDAEDTTLVRLIIDTAHTLGLHVVAEGVVSAEQVEHLREMGCDMAQGNHFSEPIPSGAVSAFLADSFSASKP